MTKFYSKMTRVLLCPTESQNQEIKNEQFSSNYTDNIEHWTLTHSISMFLSFLPKTHMLYFGYQKLYNLVPV